MAVHCMYGLLTWQNPPTNCHKHTLGQNKHTVFAKTPLVLLLMASAELMVDQKY